MHPRTKLRVDRARMLQLFLRTCSLIGALGALFCVIAINKTATSVGWIIRAAPAVAICHTIYGIHHLCRAATGRTPASSASYMIFAAILDTGLIPFFVFSAWLANADYTRNEYGWSTLFNDSDLSYKIIFAFFIVSCVQGGLFVVSLILDIYLAAKFKQIARMPPDMNPLEPNLTSRHKRNKSEGITEKNMNASALAAKRESNKSGFKRVPFIHTRTDSADSVTLYGNESARNSRVEFRKELNENEKDPWRFSGSTVSPSRPTSAVSPSPNARGAGAGLDSRPERASSPLKEKTSRPSSWLSYLDYEGVPTDMSQDATAHLDNEVRPLSPVSAISGRDPSIDRRNQERENWYEGGVRNSQMYLPSNNASRSHLDQHLAVPSVESTPKKRSREPLAMNPPTPTTGQFADENRHATPHREGRYSFEQDGEVLNDTTGNARGRPTGNSRPSSFVGSGGKARFYGDLRSSIGSVSFPFGEKKEPELKVHEVDPYERTKTMQTESDYSANFEVYESDSDEEGQLRANIVDVKSTFVPPYQSPYGVRQSSNSTGADLNAGYAGLGAEFGKGMGRRRDVSGKVAEEGRAGSESPTRNGEAGWKRFKGL